MFDYRRVYNSVCVYDYIYTHVKGLFSMACVCVVLDYQRVNDIDSNWRLDTFDRFSADCEVIFFELKCAAYNLRLVQHAAISEGIVVDHYMLFYVPFIFPL